ncbi:MAG: BolA family protein [Pseudomonadota bacterium]
MTYTVFNSRAARMSDLLANALAPTYMLLVDESAQHQGHKGVTELQQTLIQEDIDHGQSDQKHATSDLLETHFSLEITAEILNGLSRVKQHQLVYNSVADEFKTGLHSLRIKIV